MSLPAPPTEWKVFLYLACELKWADAVKQSESASMQSLTAWTLEKIHKLFDSGIPMAVTRKIQNTENSRKDIKQTQLVGFILEGIYKHIGWATSVHP